MAFAPARTAPTLSDMNITPLVDVMLVLLVIFMVTAPLLEHRIGLTLPQASPPRPERAEPVTLRVDRGDLFRLDGQAVAPAELEALLAARVADNPDLALKVDVDPEADYQSAARALAAATRAGVPHLGLVEP